MSFKSDTEPLADVRPHPAGRVRKVPVVPGIAKPPAGPQVSALAERPAPLPHTQEKATPRMWAAAGAVAVLSSVSFVWAFAQRGHETTVRPYECTVVAVSEPAKDVVDVQLNRSAGHKQVWVGNFTGVMEAHAGSRPDTYTLDTAGYLHEDVIGVYVGPTMCSNRFNLGSVLPGDEQLFAR